MDHDVPNFSFFRPIDSFSLLPSLSCHSVWTESLPVRFVFSCHPAKCSQEVVGMSPVVLKWALESWNFKMWVLARVRCSHWRRRSPRRRLFYFCL